MRRLSEIPDENRVGIQFKDFETFCRLSNNLEDFTVAVKYISQVGRPLSRKEFKRAAKVCLSGKELSSHLVDIVFVLFGSSEGTWYSLSKHSIHSLFIISENKVIYHLIVNINNKYKLQAPISCRLRSLQMLWEIVSNEKLDYHQIENGA